MPGAANAFRYPARSNLVVLIANGAAVLSTSDINLDAITLMAAEEMRRFGFSPRAGLPYHFNLGWSDKPSAMKMCVALELFKQGDPSLEVDGEMHGDIALGSQLRNKIMPNSTLTGDTNLLVMPNIESANIAYNLVKTAAGNGIAVGSIRLSCDKPVHVLTQSATVRRIIRWIHGPHLAYIWQAQYCRCDQAADAKNQGQTANRAKDFRDVEK